MAPLTRGLFEKVEKAHQLSASFRTPTPAFPSAHPTALIPDAIDGGDRQWHAHLTAIVGANVAPSDGADDLPLGSNGGARIG